LTIADSKQNLNARLEKSSDRHFRAGLNWLFSRLGSLTALRRHTLTS
jgi:hypothetical protein